MPQNSGNPTNNEFVDVELADDDEVDARSAMLEFLTDCSSKCSVLKEFF